MPFQKGGLGSLLGGATILVIAELLQDFGGQILGPYGAVPGFLVKIGVIGLCLDYSMQILRNFYNDGTHLPYWEISSINFIDLLLPYVSVFMAVYYAIFTKLIYQFTESIIKNETFTLALFFNPLLDIKSMIFFAFFFPVIYFYLSLSPEDIGRLFNPVIILQIIIKTLPSYLILIIFIFFFLLISIKLNIRIFLLGPFFSYLLKFYILQVFAIWVGVLFGARKEIFG